MTDRATARRFVRLVARLLGAAAFSLCGCSGSGTGPPTGMDSAQNMQAAAFMRYPAGSATVYASSSNANTVTSYAVPGNTITGTLGSQSGISDPAGMAFAKGHLYVTSGNQVLVFAAGATTPSLTLLEGQQFQANDVAVGTDGTVYVANYTVGTTSPVT